MRVKFPFLLVCTCAFALVAGTARAEETNVAALEATASQMVAQLEQAAQAYEQATAEVEDLASQVANNEAVLANIEARLPEQRARAASSIKSMYLFQQSAPGLLELVLNSSSFNDFLTTVRYIDSIHAHNVTEVNALADLESKLTQTQGALSVQRDAATRKQVEALAALQEVSQARQDLQQQIDALQAKASSAANASEQSQVNALVEQTIAAEGEAVKALPAQAARLTQPQQATASAEESPQPAAKSPASPSSEEERPEEAAGEPKPDESRPDEQQASGQQPGEPTDEAQPDAGEAASPGVESPALTGASDSWAARIDAYLAGSPLAGYGREFAEAAATYGVDPRLSPAIACVESGKGAVCFLPHNAWGWGSASWPDWPSAIRGHVAGLAANYGPTMTLEGAKLYAGSDIYEYWYGLVQAEMSSI